MMPPTQLPATAQPARDGLALTTAEVMHHVRLVHDLLKSVMKQNVHFGASFPGDTKKSLLLPGAQKLCFTFQLVPRFEIDCRQLENGHREYQVITSLETSSGKLIAQGVGVCSTMESKYRWRQAKLKCPNCGKDTVKRSKAEYGGGFYCHAKVGGCGSQWTSDAKAITSQDLSKTENQDIADVFNTCLKIGKKRSLVDAIITATAAGDIFSQDFDDEEDLPPEVEDAKPAKAVSSETTPAKQPEAKQAPPAEDVKALAEQCKTLYTELCELGGKVLAEPMWKAPATAPLRKALLANVLSAIKSLDETKGIEASTAVIEAIKKKNGWPTPNNDQAMQAATEIIRVAKDGK